MKVIIFDGTAKEFRSVAQSLVDSSLGFDFSDEPIADDVEDSVEPKEAIRSMLKRIPISKGQRAVYKALSEGEMSSSNLLEKIERTPGQFAGVMGAMGRRINNTKEIHQAGLPANVYAVIKYRKTEDEMYYSLTQNAEEVLKEEGVI